MGGMFAVRRGGRFGVGAGVSGKGKAERGKGKGEDVRSLMQLEGRRGCWVGMVSCKKRIVP